MAEPTDLPEWDTLATNTEEPPDAYKENGWGLTRKLGISRYMNWFMNLVYQWIVHLKSGNFYDSRTYTMTCEQYKLAAGTFDDGTERAADWSWLEMDTDEEWTAPLNVPIGDTLESVTWGFRNLATGVTTVTLEVRRCALTFGGSYATVATYTGGITESPAFSGWGEHTLTVNHVIASGYMYQLWIKPGASSSPQLRSSKVTHKRIAP